MKHFLYERQFTNIFSVGKCMAVASVATGLITQYFDLFNVAFIVIGLGYDLLIRRDIYWFGYKEGLECPICQDGILSKEVVEDSYNYKDKILKLPKQIIAVCDVCFSELMTKGKTKEIEDIIEKFKRDVDAEEKHNNDRRDSL